MTWERFGHCRRRPSEVHPSVCCARNVVSSVFPGRGLGWLESILGHSPDLRRQTSGSASGNANAVWCAKPDGDMIFRNVVVAGDTDDGSQEAIQFNQVAALPMMHVHSVYGGPRGPRVSIRTGALSSRGDRVVLAQGRRIGHHPHRWNPSQIVGKPGV